MPNVVISNETVTGGRTVLRQPQLIEGVGNCVMSLAHGSELRGSDRNRSGGGGGGKVESNIACSI